MGISVRRATARGWPRFLAYALIVLGLCSLGGPAAQAARYLESESYTLTNGLSVILYEDHRSPFVAVRVRYRVGALHEYGGRSGLAHLFEHVLFRGTEHLERQTPASVLSQIGATHMNGETSPDHTDYYEVIPSVNLETALWME